jgi:hypothetical protein
MKDVMIKVKVIRDTMSKCIKNNMKTERGVIEMQLARRPQLLAVPSYSSGEDSAVLPDTRGGGQQGGKAIDGTVQYCPTQGGRTAGRKGNRWETGQGEYRGGGERGGGWGYLALTPVVVGEAQRVKGGNEQSSLWAHPSTTHVQCLLLSSLEMLGPTDRTWDRYTGAPNCRGITALNTPNFPISC